MRSRTLSELAKLTGIKPRTLQFWAQSGVLVADSDTVHRGPGVHRQYAQIEAEIACVLAALSPFSLQVGALATIANIIRDAHEWGESADRERITSDALNIETLRRTRTDMPELFRMMKDSYSAEELAEIEKPPTIPDVEYQKMAVFFSMEGGRAGRQTAVIEVGIDDNRIVAFGLNENVLVNQLSRFPVRLVIDLGVLLPKAQH